MDKWWIARHGYLWTAMALVPIAGVALIMLLSRLPHRFRRPLIGSLVFLAGLFYATEFFLPTDPDTAENKLTPYIVQFIDPFTQILGALMIGLGLFSIIRIHSRNVATRKPGWANSAALLLAAVIMGYVGFNARANRNIDTTWQGKMVVEGATVGRLRFDLRLPAPDTLSGTARAVIQDTAYTGPIEGVLNPATGAFNVTVPFETLGDYTFVGEVNKFEMQGEFSSPTGRGLMDAERSGWADIGFAYLFEGLLNNLDAAMFSLIAFYILSAAYRAFRIRSVESTILMTSALIVILGLTFGALITAAVPGEGLASNFKIETWSQWVLSVVSSPSLRAIDLGVGVGALAMALRLWLGIERGALFGE